MMKLKKMLKMFPLFVLGFGVVVACEGLSDDLGSQFVEQNEANAYDKAYALFTYNVDNNDSIQADASVLDSVRIGAFDEPVFGKQKVSYITQARLSSYNPDFGKNPVVDSVVLTLKPAYQSATDSITTTTDENYIHPDGSVAAKKVLKTYPVKKYGKAKKTMTIKINEVNDFLGAYSDKVYSNKTVSLGTELGSKTFNGTINSVVVTKDSDNLELLNRSASLRISLDKTFFQTKIINKKGSQELKDAASFIRYFRGLGISVSEDDGYLLSMAPNDATLLIYYTYEAETDPTNKTHTSFELSLGSGNTHISLMDNNRVGTPYATAMASAAKVQDLNTKNVTPATQIFANGMGGSSFAVRIPQTTLTKLRDMYKNDKVGIMSAKIRLYNDDTSWDNSYKKPNYFLVREKALERATDKVKDSTRFLPDMALAAYTGVNFQTANSLSTKNAYYEVSVTQTLKNIIESTKDLSTFPDYFLQVGHYKTDPSSGALYGQNKNSRAYEPYRVVLKGTDINKVGQDVSNTNFKNAQLRIIFTQK